MSHLWKYDEEGFLVIEDAGDHAGPYCLRCEEVFCESCAKMRSSGYPPCTPRPTLTDYEEELEGQLKIFAGRLDVLRKEKAEVDCLRKQAAADRHLAERTVDRIRAVMLKGQATTKKLEARVAELEAELAASRLTEEDSHGEVA